MTSQDYTPEEYGRMYQQEARIEEMQEEAYGMNKTKEELIRLQELREMIPLARYTKDLEDMLQRAIEALEAGPGYASIVGIVLEAKALLERTGYTEDF